MKKRVALSIVVVSLLLMGLQTIDVSGVKSIRNAIDDHLAPTVSSPPDIIYTEGSIGIDISWEIYDNNPSHYYITKDDVTVKNMLWDAPDAIAMIWVDGLAVGNYEYMVYACDDTRTTTDSVRVTFYPADLEMHSPISINTDAQFEAIEKNHAPIARLNRPLKIKNRR